jgi:D-glycerate 3-kinase
MNATWLFCCFRYDKSAFAGRGDRADPSTWPVVSGPVELVFFEGWMLGFKPVGDEAAGGVEGALLEVNRQLGAYQESWDSLVDSWLIIRIADPQVQWGYEL